MNADRAAYLMDLAERIASSNGVYHFSPGECMEAMQYVLALLKPAQTLRPKEEYHEDYGAVLWWSIPINEPPWCGQPSDSDVPDPFYHTHFTRLFVPTEPPKP